MLYAAGVVLVLCVLCVHLITGADPAEHLHRVFGLQRAPLGAGLYLDACRVVRHLRED